MVATITVPIRKAADGFHCLRTCQQMGYYNFLGNRNGQPRRLRAQCILFGELRIDETNSAMRDKECMKREKRLAQALDKKMGLSQ